MMTTLILCLAALVSVAGWYVFWNGQAKKFVKSGYTPPAASWFGIFGFTCFTYLLLFLTVGKVKVVRKAPLPKKGRFVFVGPHQLPCDFAMLRKAAGHPFRMLTAADQLGGFFGLLCAVGGVISVAFKNKTDGADAQVACEKALAQNSFRVPLAAALSCWALLAVGFGYCVTASLTWPAVACVVGALVVAGCAGAKPALGVFPQGSLLPDDQEFKEMFRPGAIRMAREAQRITGETVYIVPEGLWYNRDAKLADIFHKHLKGMRSMFETQRSPKSSNLIFKINLDELPEAERAEIVRQQKEIMRAYKASRAPVYGGVAIRGEAIAVDSLPEDPIAAIEVIKLKVIELQREARSL